MSAKSESPSSFSFSRAAGQPRRARAAAARRLFVAVAGLAAGALATASTAHAESRDLPGPESLTLRPVVASDAGNDAAMSTPSTDPVFLAEMAATEEKPNIHGFIESPFKTSYITPRGLVVENAGVVWQPVGGIVFPIGDAGPVKGITFVTGIWNSVNTAQGDPKVGAWNEMDVFASFSGNVDKFSATLTYGAWNFPNSTINKPSTEHVADLKVSYDDTGMFGDSMIALHPYFDFFYSISGSSNVVNGKNGSTYYFEIGCAPSYTYKAIENYPLTLSFPVYISVGPEGYWGRGDSAFTAPDGNLGVLSAAAKLEVPLPIPARYGYWHADASVIYYHLFNDALLRAGTLLSGNTDRDIVQGTIGVGVNF